MDDILYHIFLLLVFSITAIVCFVVGYDFKDLLNLYLGRIRKFKHNGVEWFCIKTDSRFESKTYWIFFSKSSIQLRFTEGFHFLTAKSIFLDKTLVPRRPVGNLEFYNVWPFFPWPNISSIDKRWEEVISKNLNLDIIGKMEWIYWPHFPKTSMYLKAIAASCPDDYTYMFKEEFKQAVSTMPILGGVILKSYAIRRLILERKPIIEQLCRDLKISKHTLKVFRKHYDGDKLDQRLSLYLMTPEPFQGKLYTKNNTLYQILEALEKVGKDYLEKDYLEKEDSIYVKNPYYPYDSINLKDDNFLNWVRQSNAFLKANSSEYRIDYVSMWKKDNRILKETTCLIGSNQPGLVEFEPAHLDDFVMQLLQHIILPTISRPASVFANSQIDLKEILKTNLVIHLGFLNLLEISNRHLSIFTHDITSKYSPVGKWTPFLKGDFESRGNLTVVELLDQISLSQEGKAMCHCVASYASRCASLRSRIFSVRNQENQSLSTVEISVPNLLSEPVKVIQHRGFGNREPSQECQEAVSEWLLEVNRNFNLRNQNFRQEQNKREKVFGVIKCENVHRYIDSQIGKDWQTNGIQARLWREWKPVLKTKASCAEDWLRETGLLSVLQKNLIGIPSNKT